MNFCKDLIETSKWGSKFVKLTKNANEKDIWLHLLGLPNGTTLKDPSVCVHHFQSVDIQPNGTISFKTLTKHGRNSGNDSTNAPPRPSALRDVLVCVVFNAETRIKVLTGNI